MLKDDFKRLRKNCIINSLKKLRKNDGNFKSVSLFEESDLRFIYSACVISYLIDDFSGIDIELTHSYILSCRNQNGGGFGLCTYLESHAGATYCAIASLKLLNKLDNL